MNPHVDTLERKPVYPVSYGDTAGNNPDVLEREAMSIKSELTGANRERTQDLISQLKGLQSRIPVGGRKSRRTSSVIATAIVQAQQQLEVQMLDHSWRSSEVMPVVMEAALYHGMTVAQKAFYNDIEKKAEYNLAAVNEKGKIEATGEKKITGEELRKHFGVLQYHSLKESEKRELLSKTFGTAAPDEDTPKTKAQLKADQEELASIHRALHDMEAYKAYVLLVHSGLGVRGAGADFAQPQGICESPCGYYRPARRLWRADGSAGRWHGECKDGCGAPPNEGDAER